MSQQLSHRAKITSSLIIIASPALADGFDGFSAPIPHFAGDGPNDVAVADFNLDGVLDFVCVDHWGDTITAFKGDGDATFNYSGQYATSNAPQAVEAGDLDEDGFPDVLVVGEYSSNFLAVMRNQGHTAHLRFDPPALYPVGDSPRCLVSGDFNGDGHLDVAVGNRMTTDVSILLGNGDGSLQPHVLYPISGAPHAIIAADFNGDGDLDLATANWGANQVAILLNDGDGTFAPRLLSPVGEMPFGLDSADFNGDGIPDIATSNFWDGTASVLIGNGDGTFQPFASFAVDESNLEGIAAADFDRDGNDDIVVMNGFWYNISILRGNGDGTFQPKQVFDCGSFPRGITKADLDGDGDLDLFIANLAADRVSVLVNLTTPSVRTPAELVDAAVVFGSLISGGVNEVRVSDNLRLRGRSSFGFSAQEPNLYDLQIGAMTGVNAPAALDISVEGRLNHGGGAGKWRLRNWSTNSFQQVHQYSIGTTESTEEITGIDATDRVRASDGRIELSIRQSVLATFSAQGFDSYTDHVAIEVVE